MDCRFNKPHLTAIARHQPSTPAHWLYDNGLLIGRKLDYGCGRGFDADTYRMEKFDPYWYPEQTVGTFDTICCTYVLNVVSEAQQEEILESIRKLLTDGGRAFITVRRDVCNTKTQRLVKLSLPIIYKNSRYAIYEMNC